MFFQELSKIIDGVDINLTIHKQDGELTILVIPVITEKSTEKLTKTDKENKPKVSKPMSIKGSPEELDKEFFNSVGEALKETSGFAAKTGAYKEQLKKNTEELEKKVSSKRPGFCMDYYSRRNLNVPGSRSIMDSYTSAA
jgi:PRTRC genetic system protein E